MVDNSICEKKPKKCAILQSNYIPWKGYFDLIGSVDLFIFHDDLQYTKGDWRNRNKIKTPKGSKWLTVPCGTSEHRLICEVVINDHSWQQRHWAQICSNYSKAPYFKKYEAFFEQLYLGCKWSNLSDMNQAMIVGIARELLGIETRFEDSSTYAATTMKATRVLELLKKCGAKSYLSGPAAKAYLNVDDFEKAGVDLYWMDYTGYPEYPQLSPPFTHQVSILDMLFNLGESVPDYMLFKRNGRVL